MTNLEFIQIWQMAKSPTEVRQKTNLSVKAIYARVGRLRTKGVPLKYFREITSTDKLIDAAKMALNQEH